MRAGAALAALGLVVLAGCAGDGQRPFLAQDGASANGDSAKTAARVRVPRPMPRYVPGEGPARVAPLAARGLRGQDRAPESGAEGAAQTASAGKSDGGANGVAASASRPEQAARAPEASELIGLAPPALQELMGQPRLRWVEGPARVWQYSQSSCVLDIYLQAQTGDPAVTHVEARTGNGHSADADQCYARLLAQSSEPVPARAPASASGG